MPFVSVPWLDRAADDPALLLSLVTPLLVRDKERAESVWEHAMADWAVADKFPADGEPVPLEGINTVSALIGGLSEAFGPSRQSAVDAVQGSLRALALYNSSYREALRGSNRIAERKKWIKAVEKERSSLRNALATLVCADAGAQMSGDQP